MAGGGSRGGAADHRGRMTTLGKVVVNRAVSIDGFIFGPKYTRFWVGGRKIGDVVPWEATVEAAKRTGAMLVGRNTSDVGDKMEAEEAGSVDYPFDGEIFLLTHRPPDVVEGFTVLSGDIRAAVDTALAAAKGKDLELLGADVAS